jgi:hypothetical protein
LHDAVFLAVIPPASKLGALSNKLLTWLNTRYALRPMPGDMPTGKFAVRPHSSEASVDESAVAVTTAFTGSPAGEFAGTQAANTEGALVADGQLLVC